MRLRLARTRGGFPEGSGKRLLARAGNTLNEAWNHPAWDKVGDFLHRGGAKRAGKRALDAVRKAVSKEGREKAKKALRKAWRRRWIFNPRREEAKALHRARASDREAYKAFLDRWHNKNRYYYVRSGHRKYSEMFNADIPKEIAARIATGQTPRLLELSAGESLFARGIKRKFNSRVEVTATGATQPPLRRARSGALLELDEFHVGTLNHLSARWAKTNRKFDFIVCHAGETQSFHPAGLAQHLRPILARDGVAYVEIVLPRQMDVEPAWFSKHGLKAETRKEWNEGPMSPTVYALKVTHLPQA